MSKSKPSKGNILVIGGQPADLRVLVATLSGQGYEVQSATSGQLALKAIRTSPPDLILLDVGVLDTDGYEICRRLKADEGTRDIPVIFSGARGEPQEKAGVFAAGGADYVARPFQKEEVLARVEMHLALKAMQKQLEKKDALLEHEIAEHLRTQAALRETEEECRHLAEHMGEVMAARKLVEEQARQQGHFLTRVLESLTHPFYVIDANDYTIQIANSAARLDSLSGHATCYALTHGQSRPCATPNHPCPLEEVKRTRKPVTVEHVHCDQDGNARNVEVHAYPLFDSEDKVIQVIEYALDITERRKVEEALRESEARWRSVTENSPDHVLILDTDLNIQFVNYASPGLTTEELIGTPLYAYVSEERQPEIKAILENVLKTGEPASYETEYGTPDGSAIYYESRVVPRTLDDRIIGLAVNARDITRRRRAEEALQKSEALLKETQRLAKVGGWEFHLGNRQVIWTEEVYRIHEVPLDFEPQLENALSFYAPEHRPILEQAIQRAAETGEPWDLELQFITARDKRLWVRAIGKAERQNGKVVKLSGTFQDITERRQTEQALREAKEAAEAARREETERRREAERRRQIAESLADVLAALNSNQPLDSVLAFIAQQAKQLLNSQAVAICSLPNGVGKLVVQASQGLTTDRVAGADIPVGQKALRQAVASRQPVVIDDLATVASVDGERAALAETGIEPYQALLAVPIVIKDEVYGGMVLYYAQPRTFSSDEVELAVVFDDQVALAIENARLRDQIEQAAMAAERSRLARDLHDSVTQALFSASLVAEVLPRVWRRDPDEAQQGLEELRHLTRGALAEMRTLLLELRPTALVETKLDDLLPQLTEAVTSRAQLVVTLNIDSIPTLPPDVHVTFYRVGQEALHNVVKHAQASQLTVSLCASPPVFPGRALGWQGQIRLCVSDDGRGFDPSHIGPDELGLSIMHERAEAIGARLTIESQPGRGTRVTLVWQNT